MTANKPVPGVPGVPAAETQSITADEPVPGLPAAETQAAAAAVAAAPAEVSTPPLTPTEPGTAVRKPRRKRRFVLSFPGMRHRTIPHGYLHVHEALDRLGESLYPEDWGYIDGFSDLPFQFIDGNFVRYVLRHRGANVVVEKQPFARAAPMPQRRKLRQVGRLYFTVGERLRLALERKAVTARKFTPTGECVEISSVGIWAANVISVFFLGVLRDKGEDGKVAALPVLIDKDQFETWLTKLNNSSELTVSPDRPRKLRELSEETLDVIVSYVSSHGYKLTRDEFTTALREALSDAKCLLATKAIGTAWQHSALEPIKLTSGRLSKSNRTAADGAYAGLVTVIKESVLRS